MIGLTILKRWIITFSLGITGALLLFWLHGPLPWMIGPLLGTIAGRLIELPIAVPPQTRNIGQWIIGLSLGLYFTPEVIAKMENILPAVMAGAMIALVMGTLAGWLLTRLSHQDATTCYFAAMPGGASEMATVAERYHVHRVDLITAAHSLRIMVVVIVIPAIYVLLNLHGSARYQGTSPEVYWPGLVALLLFGAMGAMILNLLCQPNAWFIGPLIVTAIITATDHTWSAIPVQISAAGQLFIGCSLGTRFSRRFLNDAPRFLLSSLVATVFLMIAMAGVGMIIAWAADLWRPSVILGLAPGGIAEMCITAKILQLSVPVVTAFHVVRSLLVVTLSGPFFGWLQKHNMV